MEKPHVDKKHEEVGAEWTPTKDKPLDEVIAKLKENKYQYASAGEVKRLIDELEAIEKAWTEYNQTLNDSGVRYVLDAESFDELEATINNPPPPNEKLKKLLRT